MAKVRNKNPEGTLELSWKNQKVIEIAEKKPTITADKITILHVAAMHGNSKLCKLIMDNVIDLNLTDSNEFKQNHGKIGLQVSYQ